VTVTVWAWGTNVNGTIGDGTTTNPKRSGRRARAPLNCRHRRRHLPFARDRGGRIRLGLGRNVGSQLGDGTTTVRTSPVQIAGPGMMWKIATPVLSLASGLYTTAQTVTVTLRRPGCCADYTTDGTNPTEDAPVIGSGSTSRSIKALR